LIGDICAGSGHVDGTEREEHLQSQADDESNSNVEAGDLFIAPFAPATVGVALAARAAIFALSATVASTAVLTVVKALAAAAALAATLATAASALASTSVATVIATFLPPVGKDWYIQLSLLVNFLTITIPKCHSGVNK